MMNKIKIKVGSRESALAVKQSQLAIECIEKYHNNIEIELITMKTTGDIILDKTLDKIGGKGLFVKELDKALKDGAVDITVHSFKDMPMEVDSDLPIVAVSHREDPRDVLILPKGATEIDFSKPIGCSSQRRKIQLEEIFAGKGCTIKPIRGNVLTRLEKLDSAEYSAIVLAYAGIKRLGLENRINRVFETKEMLPAGCQGVMVVQARSGFDTSFLKEFNDIDAQDCTRAERAFIKELDGGCSSPVAAYATVESDAITITGMYVGKSGLATKKTVTGQRQEGEKLGRALAIEMRNADK